MKKTQVKWRCRRATLELDLLMHGFFEACYDDLDAKAQLAFQALLAVDDQILIAWFFQGQPCDQPRHQAMVQRLLAYAQREA